MVGREHRRREGGHEVVDVGDLVMSLSLLSSSSTSLRREGGI